MQRSNLGVLGLDDVDLERAEVAFEVCGKEIDEGGTARKRKEPGASETTLREPICHLTLLFPEFRSFTVPGMGSAPWSMSYLSASWSAVVSSLGAIWNETERVRRVWKAEETALKASLMDRGRVFWIEKRREWVSADVEDGERGR